MACTAVHGEHGIALLDPADSGKACKHYLHSYSPSLSLIYMHCACMRVCCLSLSLFLYLSVCLSVCVRKCVRASIYHASSRHGKCLCCSCLTDSQQQVASHVITITTLPLELLLAA